VGVEQARIVENQKKNCDIILQSTQWIKINVKRAFWKKPGRDREFLVAEKKPVKRRQEQDEWVTEYDDGTQIVIPGREVPLLRGEGETLKGGEGE